MEYVIHGSLMSGAIILQSKGHDNLLIQPDMARAPESSFCDVFYGHKYLIVPSTTIHEADDFVSCSSVDNASATGIGYPSIGVALFKSLKSMHTRSLTFFL
jgi:hypothetical protein